MEYSKVKNDLLCIFYHDYQIDEIYPVDMLSDDGTHRKVVAFVAMKCTRCGKEKHIPQFKEINKD